MTETWPKIMDAAKSGQRYCILCRKPINYGEKYHFLTLRGRKLIHAVCYEKEMKRHD